MTATRILLWVVLTIAIILCCSAASYHAGWRDAMETCEPHPTTTSQEPATNWSRVEHKRTGEPQLACVWDTEGGGFEIDRCGPVTTHPDIPRTGVGMSAQAKPDPNAASTQVDHVMWHVDADQINWDYNPIVIGFPGGESYTVDAAEVHDFNTGKHFKLTWQDKGKTFRDHWIITPTE